MNVNEEELAEMLKNKDLKVDTAHSQLGQYYTPAKVTGEKVIDPSEQSMGWIMAHSSTVKKKLTVQKPNKYGAVRTWSELCGRTFDSKAEANRADELYLREKSGEIRKLMYQVKFELCGEPKITYTADFYYQIFDPLTLSGGTWKDVYEDVKGVLTRDTRTKIAWTKEKYGIEVRLVK